MTVGLVKVLVKCGALPPKNTGPANPRSAEDAKRVKSEQQSAAAKRRRQLIREAKEKGETSPTFRPGRPRKYTPEEAQAVKAAKNRVCLQGYNQRLRDGIVSLETILCAQNEATPSTDEHFFVAPN